MQDFYIKSYRKNKFYQMVRQDPKKKKKLKRN